MYVIDVRKNIKKERESRNLPKLQRNEFSTHYHKNNKSCYDKSVHSGFSPSDYHRSLLRGESYTFKRLQRRKQQMIFGCAMW